MSEEDKEEIKLTPAEDNPWYQLMQVSDQFDYHNITPRGTHWFYGLYYLYNVLPGQIHFLLDLVQEELPDGHWLNKLDDDKLKEICKTTECAEFLKIIEGLAEKCKIKLGSLDNAIDFSNLHFNDPIDFSNFVFPINVSFEYTKFSDNVLFDSTYFCGSTKFNSVNFYSTATFRKTTFTRIVHFQEAKFFGGTSFNKVLFPLITNFQNTEFFEMTDFTNTNFAHTVIFRQAVFHSLPVFKNTAFGGTTNLLEVQFKTHVPNFVGAEINADIIWDKNSNLWPQTKIGKKNEAPEEYKYRIEINQNSYENLANHMKHLEKYHDEHFFFRQETRCRQQLEENLFIRFPYWLYEKISNYGYGVERALFWWFLNMLGGFIALLIISYQGGTTISNPFGCSFFTSIANAHSFLFFHDGPLETCYMTFKNRPYFDFIWATQTILGIPLAFLIALTLRVRFRLR